MCNEIGWHDAFPGLLGNACALLVHQARHGLHALKVSFCIGGVGDLVLRIQKLRNKGQCTVLLRHREWAGATIETTGCTAVGKAQAIHALCRRVTHAVVTDLRIRAELITVHGSHPNQHRFDLVGPFGVTGR